MYKEEWGFGLAWLWNLALIAGSLSLLAGFNQGIEAAEFPIWIDLPIFLVFLLMTIQVFGTIFRRKEPRLYVALWYTMAAFIWTDMNYALGNFIFPYWISARLARYRSDPLAEEKGGLPAQEQEGEAAKEGGMKKEVWI